MFDTDNIIPKEIRLLDGQIDIILRALELYAFNLHNTWSVNVDDSKEELRNALLFHTYEGLLAEKTSLLALSKTNGEYKIAYDVIEEYYIIRSRNKFAFYYCGVYKSTL